MNGLIVARRSDERALLAYALQRAGLVVATDADAEHALGVWPERPADLVVLASAGAVSPIPFVRRLRGFSQVPIVLVADGVLEGEHIALLDAGADLVVARPYSSCLLVSQVRSLLRRAGGVPIFSLPTLSLAGLSLDPATRMVRVDAGEPRRLTQLEFRLLYTLMAHRGQVLPADAIVEHVWGYTDAGSRDLVRGLVNRLRAKVEAEPRQPRFVRTIPGLGYAFGDVEHT